MPSLSERIQQLQGEKVDPYALRQQNEQAAERAERAKEQSEATEVQKLLGLLDSFGAREHLEELRDEIWGGVGTITTHKLSRDESLPWGSKDTIWRKPNKDERITAQYKLSFTYLCIGVSEISYSSPAYSNINYSHGTLSQYTGGSTHHTSIEYQFDKPLHSVSVHMTQGSPNISVRGYRVGRMREYRETASVSDPTTSRSNLQQMLARVCVELEWAPREYRSSLTQLKERAYAELRKHGLNEAEIQKLEVRYPPYSFDSWQKLKNDMDFRYSGYLK